MSQGWTIIDKGAGEVLHAYFVTPSYGSHPKDNGWAWDAVTQTATRVYAAPDPAAEIWDGGAWVADLPTLRERRWAEARAYRDRIEAGGAATPQGRVDSDANSRSLILGARELAKDALAAGIPFVMPWTMADNNVVNHGAAEMLAMSAAVGLHVAACHAAAREVRVAIELASDAAAIAAVDIQEGYP